MFRYNRIFFIISNFLIVFIIFYLLFKIRYDWVDFDGVEKRVLTIYLIFLFSLYSLTFIIIKISFKTYEINKISRITESIFINSFISIVSIGIFGIYFYLTQTNFARLVFFLGFLLSPFVIAVYNKALFMLISKKKKPYNILFFGCKRNYHLFEALINEYSKWFTMSMDKVFMNQAPLQLKEKLPECDLLAVDTDQNYNKDQLKILNTFEIDGGKIYSLIDIFSYFDQSLPAEIIENNHYDLFSYYKLDSLYSRFFKRLGDILISIFLLVISSPIMLATALLIKISSSGPVIYTQDRVTTHNKVFKIYKFRSMKITRQKTINFTSPNDARITWIGKIIRPLRIDEIPQLFNIIKGDMAFIGPRPERPELINEILKKNPLFKKRLLVKPGLTGWAQVKYTYVNQIDDMNKKLSYDLFYINNLSFVFDLKILLYTIETILFRRGAL
jgi:lipopolysaccharide/colanic/teichoic acid biosynthesis glycosyltransferase